ncbi:hypothetical protein L484_021501 [Morus notabilis]|uniref:Uncharacterized protein n=1 Tax=Morus notabilis TaxID=981085 RepID=W9T0D2_9ROSA|nr:hypothetical protein L484_021501 [Morus notabilis]
MRLIGATKRDMQMMVQRALSRRVFGKLIAEQGSFLSDLGKCLRGDWSREGRRRVERGESGEWRLEKGCGCPRLNPPKFLMRLAGNELNGPKA